MLKSDVGKAAAEYRFNRYIVECKYLYHTAVSIIIIDLIDT